jgi:hypothetical protein
MSKYTENQIRAIKKIQAMSWNDCDFQAKIPWHNMTFNNVLESGYWSLEDLERMGAELYASDTRTRSSYTFHICSGRRHPRRKMQRIPQKHQFEYKARSLNERDGVKRR